MSLSTPQQVQARLDEAMRVLQTEERWDSPSVVMNGLDALRVILAFRQNEQEEAAGEKLRLTRQWEKRLAIQGRIVKGSSADVRKATAYAMAAEQDDLYDRLTEVEATHAAATAAIRTFETMVGIAQSTLKGQGRA